MPPHPKNVEARLKESRKDKLEKLEEYLNCVNQYRKEVANEPSATLRDCYNQQFEDQRRILKRLKTRVTFASDKNFGQPVDSATLLELKTTLNDLKAQFDEASMNNRRLQDWEMTYPPSSTVLNQSSTASLHPLPVAPLLQDPKIHLNWSLPHLPPDSHNTKRKIDLASNFRPIQSSRDPESERFDGVPQLPADRSARILPPRHPTNRIQTQESPLGYTTMVPPFGSPLWKPRDPGASKEFTEGSQQQFNPGQQSLHPPPQSHRFPPPRFANQTIDRVRGQHTRASENTVESGHQNAQYSGLSATNNSTSGQDQIHMPNQSFTGHEFTAQIETPINTLHRWSDFQVFGRQNVDSTLLTGETSSRSSLSQTALSSRISGGGVSSEEHEAQAHPGWADPSDCDDIYK
ncbi:hypothetical protein CVT25_014475 [Psilocybe cyanescens]|uniref:Uncharacterized protein n=1 Tax=Psilocybe cyanescens TaxID=93625 RepID=A0A409XRM9_PSICY|nr:hypothetical protein CVT25_014475 [Psilocybe cyanescens]